MAKPSPLPQTQLERQKQWKKRGDAFWNVFLPTKNGRMKSTLLMNSFCLSLLFLGIYIMAYLLLLDGLDAMLSEKLPLFWVNVVESLVPAVIGTFFCNLLHFVFSDKRLVSVAFVWLLLYAVAATLYLLVGSPPQARGTIFQLLMMVVPAPILTGCGLSVFLYFRHLKRHPPKQSVQTPPPWKQRRR